MKTVSTTLIVLLTLFCVFCGLPVLFCVGAAVIDAFVKVSH